MFCCLVNPFSLCSLQALLFLLSGIVVMTEHAAWLCWIGSINAWRWPLTTTSKNSTIVHLMPVLSLQPQLLWNFTWCFQFHFLLKCRDSSLVLRSAEFAELLFCFVSSLKKLFCMVEMDINTKPRVSVNGSDNFIPFQRMDELLTLIKPHVWLCHCLTWIFYYFTWMCLMEPFDVRNNSF